MLDMVEFGVIQYKAIDAIGSKRLSQYGSKPCFLISGMLESCLSKCLSDGCPGPKFKDDEVYSTIANLMVDFFRGQVVQEINLKGLDHVITLTVKPNGNIEMR